MTLSHVAFGETLIGSHGKPCPSPCPKPSKDAISGPRCGKSVHSAGGNGTS
jgi:hypothetical protein